MGKYNLPELNLEHISKPHFIDIDEIPSLRVFDGNVSHWDLSGS